MIHLTFIQGAVEHGAQWRLQSSGHLEAIDEEARWLTETASPTGVQSFTSLPLPAPVVSADRSDIEEREALVDQLNAQRGKPQEIEYELDDEEDRRGDIRERPHLPAGVESLAARIHSLTEARKSSPEVKEPAETISPSKTSLCRSNSLKIFLRLPLLRKSRRGVPFPAGTRSFSARVPKQAPLAELAFHRVLRSRGRPNECHRARALGATIDYPAPAS